jgi:hypothetical protein
MNATKIDPRSKSSNVSTDVPVATRQSAPATTPPMIPTTIVPMHPRLGAPTARRASPPARSPTTHHATIPMGRP